VRYATRILGLELVRRDRSSAYLRADDRDHTLVTPPGNPREHIVAFELRTVAELDRPRRSSRGAAPGAGRHEAGIASSAALTGLISFPRPTGNTIELVTRLGAQRQALLSDPSSGITSVFAHSGLIPSMDPRQMVATENAR